MTFSGKFPSPGTVPGRGMVPGAGNVPIRPCRRFRPHCPCVIRTLDSGEADCRTEGCPAAVATFRSWRGSQVSPCAGPRPSTSPGRTRARISPASTRLSTPLERVVGYRAPLAPRLARSKVLYPVRGRNIKGNPLARTCSSRRRGKQGRPRTRSHPKRKCSCRFPP